MIRTATTPPSAESATGVVRTSPAVLGSTWITGTPFWNVQRTGRPGAGWEEPPAITRPSAEITVAVVESVAPTNPRPDTLGWACAANEAAPSMPPTTRTHRRDFERTTIGMAESPRSDG